MGGEEAVVGAQASLVEGARVPEHAARPSFALPALRGQRAQAATVQDAFEGQILCAFEGP